MRCDDAVEAIQEVLRGAGTPMELALRLPAPVHAHLQDCPDCRAAAHELLSLDRELGAMADAVAPPVDLTASIMGVVAAVPVGGQPLRPVLVSPDDIDIDPIPVRRPRRLALASGALLVSALAVLMRHDVARAWAESPVGAAVKSFIDQWYALDWREVGHTLSGWIDAAGAAATELSLGDTAPALAYAIATVVIGAALAFSWRFSTRVGAPS